MTEEQRIALMRANCTAAIIEVVAMAFANVDSVMKEKPLKFVGTDFMGLIEKYKLREADARDLLERG